MMSDEERRVHHNVACQRWAAKNPEKVREKSKRWDAMYPERRREIGKRCDLRTRPHRVQVFTEVQKARVNETRRLRRLANPDKVRQTDNHWYAMHPEQAKLTGKLWGLGHPEQIRKIAAKRAAKHRTLGFVPMNRPFNDSDAHHLNQTDVVYIPKELHRSISHNVFTGKNMTTINALAGQWLTEGWT